MFVHVYTGNGKGKTTAALGLALRAIGAGKKVFIGQFVKNMDYSEINSLKLLPNNKIEKYGVSCFIDRNPEKKDYEAAKNGLKRIKEILSTNEYDIVVLDEINIAMYFKLISVEEVLKVLKERNKNIEVILTGRYAPKELIEYADLVSDIKEVKHYYNKGILSRKGIDK
ncbi:cob(I)alamin adenolsyltransferase/cobinamide ATP-dependent adenolsyltransferase [Tepiditoga spiralis]|uniref:Cob(I)alamin adenolsyltransferase/cobinamide ATP-dependent adenolsyltransferase n=1 Tax=Tepiditoga spiralis TaxID=2108365 RepID=A0A7G1G8Y2_9BACT|nr:cob(I)yrinic acid a,c-diamide adenosyltransferase [Tepiditoga spiralis]BBE31704.1 cob(I)alamin adenolsyltransferase/cobinamide ATP-dependent adenolsyltransferase [Tepiditoga spiralis]